MTDSPTKEERFKPAQRLIDWSGSDGSPFEVANVSDSCSIVSIEECDLNLEGARALRDWLNKALPKDTCKPGEHSYQDAPICVHCGDQP